MGANLVFGAGLLVISVGFVIWNIVAWRRSDNGSPGTTQRVFERRQVRSRVHTSVLIGLVGIAIIGSTWLRHPVAAAFYWMGILLAVLWIVCAGFFDLVSSRAFYRRMQKQQSLENVTLQAQLDQIRRQRNNGRKDPP